MREKEQVIAGLTKIINFFREVVRKEGPQFELSEEAKKSLLELILRENPKGSEAFFLAVGKGLFVEKVYTQKGFSERSGFRRIKKGVIESSLSFEEEMMLFEEIRSLGGGKDNVLFIGHLHPSGTVNVEGEDIQIPPSESLLFPSQNDLKHMRKDVKLGLSYAAIATNTENGPCIAIYPLRQMLIQENPKKLPRTIINLSV